MKKIKTTANASQVGVMAQLLIHDVAETSKKHSHLSVAKNEKDDEYYTRKEDVELELKHYKQSIKDKTVYCNCDGEKSAFKEVLVNHFHDWGLKKLYCSGISGYCMEYDGVQMKEYQINGDFRSKDSRAILKRCDVVITNPPFSLIREWLNVVSSKDLIFIANKTVISYQTFFPMIQCGYMKIGYSRPNLFYRSDGNVAKLQGLSRWFTTFPVKKEKPAWKPTCKYSGQYRRFDLYPAINVNKVKDIPVDYLGLMGVPITFMDKIDSDSFQIVDLIYRYAIIDKTYGVKGRQLTEVDGKAKFSRLIIKKK